MAGCSQGGDPAIGTNRRYPNHAWKLREDQIMREGKPDTLTESELEKDEQPFTRPAKPIPVTAWVRYDGEPIRVRAELLAWTPNACAIRWETEAGEHRAWVWASAVRNR